MRKSLTPHLLALLLLGTLSQAAPREDVYLQSKVDEIFAPWNNTSSPGCSLALIRDGSIIYSKGYGMANLEHGIAISPSSVFYVGSVSKQFVATAIALLAEEGKLDLDDDIRNFYDNRLGKGDSRLLERLQTPGRLNDGEELNYAFGLDVGEYRGLETIRHGGALGGYRSHLVRFPSERFSVAIECNLDAINLGPLADKVADLYLEDKLAAKQRPKSTEATPEVETAPSETDSPSAATLSDYAGEYWSEELQVTYHLFMEDGDLYGQVQTNPATPLRLLAEDVLSADRAKMTFVRDDEEHIQSFILDAGRVRNLRFEKGECTS